MEKIFTIKNIIIYLLSINILTFFAMGIDKRKAKRGKWRIPEKTLFSLVVVGGGIGRNSGYVYIQAQNSKDSILYRISIDYDNTNIAYNCNNNVKIAK